VQVSGQGRAPPRLSFRLAARLGRLRGFAGDAGASVAAGLGASAAGSLAATPRLFQFLLWRRRKPVRSAPSTPVLAALLDRAEKTWSADAVCGIWPFSSTAAGRRSVEVHTNRDHDRW